MRTWITTILVMFIIFILLTNVQASSTINVSANNAVLIEQSTGRILYSKNAHEKQSIASITKMMTAIIAIEQGNLEDTVTVSERAVWAEGSSIYLEEGEKIPLLDLIYGLMLRSGNDAAIAISEHIAESVEGFSILMNEKARWLGMTNTYFENPHGLESDNHYSTAYDMALLLQYAMENDIFSQISSTTSYLSENRTYKWHNKNKLLTQLYEYCTGGKTGFTKKAGRTLATTAHKNGMDLIAVTLNAPDDWQDHIRMFEWGYDHYNFNQLNPQGIEKYLITETNELIDGYILDDVFYPLTDDEKKSVHTQTFFLTSHKRNEEQIGEKVFFIQSQPIKVIPIYDPEKQQLKNNWYPSLIESIQKIVGLKTNG